MADESQQKTTRMRSPAYPSVNLEAAIDHAKVIYDKEKRSSAPVLVVATHWGTNIKSSKGLRLIAALKQFGLVNEEGEGEDRHVRLSNRALDLIVQTNRLDPAWRKAVAEAALAPRIHKALWEHFASSLPSDDNLRVYLIRQMEFHDYKVRRFIKEFRATLAFAGLLDSGRIADTDLDEDHDNGDGQVPVVGNYVQWTYQGVCQFTEPRKVLGVSNDGRFAFVEGEEKGFPMTELTVQECPSTVTTTTTTPPPANPYFKPKLPEDEIQRLGISKAILPLLEGSAVLTLPDKLSEDSARDFESWIELMVGQTLRKAGVKRTQSKGG